MRAREFIREYDQSRDATQQSAARDAATAATDAINRARVSSQSNQQSNQQPQRSSNQQSDQERSPKNPRATQPQRQRNFDYRGRDIGDFTIVWSNGSMVVAEPHDASAARYWALYTERWPLSDIETDEQFNKYVADQGQPLIISLIGRSDRSQKYLWHPDSDKNQLTDYRGRPVSFHTTFRRYPRLRQFLKNNAREGDSAIRNVSSQTLEALNSMIQNGVRTLASEGMTRGDTQRYNQFIERLAQEHGLKNDDGQPDRDAMLRDPHLRAELRSNPLGLFWSVVDELTRMSIGELRSAASAWGSTVDLRTPTIREIDEVYAYLIERELGRWDRGLADEVRDLLVVRRTRDAAKTLDGQVNNHTLGRIGDFTVYIKRADIADKLA